MVYYYPGERGTPYDSLYVEALPERDTIFRLQVYERVGILLVEAYERLGKSANYKVFKGHLIKIFRTDAPYGCIKIFSTLHIMKRRLHVIRYVKGVPFFNRMFTKSVPFFVKRGLLKGTGISLGEGGGSLPKRTLLSTPSLQTITVIPLLLRSDRRERAAT